MEQDKEIKQNWPEKRPENCFCVVFDSFLQSFIFGRLSTKFWLYPIVVPTISYIPKILSFSATHEATLVFILDIKLYFACCDELSLC